MSHPDLIVCRQQQQPFVGNSTWEVRFWFASAYEYSVLSHRCLFAANLPMFLLAYPLAGIYMRVCVYVYAMVDD
jgi:hypothetical protein